MYLIGQILIHDDRREFHHRIGLEHLHIQIHVKDAPKIYENSSQNDCAELKTASHADTCKIKTNTLDLHDMVSIIQTHHHKTTKKTKNDKDEKNNENDKDCGFGAPWPIFETIHIVHGKIIDKNEYKQSKRLLVDL